MNAAKFGAFLLSSLLMAGASFAQPEGGQSVKVYAAAVVKTPLTAIAAEFERRTGNHVTVAYDTAGATEQRFRADPGAAVLITTVPLIRNAEGVGALRDGTSTILGSTVAGVAVSPRSKKPDISTSEKLRAVLLAANRVAVSDPARGATVGTHFMNAIEKLGIKNEIVPKIIFSRDGVETVRLVLDGRADIGVSQSSEILQGNREAYAGPFPDELALVTEFALWHRSTMPPAVGDFVALIAGPFGREILAADGILPSP